MKIYLSQNVYEAALDRIRRLFAEFQNVVVATSGGKDSTVVLHLTLQVAAELGRLPVRVLFIDQEAEWNATVELVRETMARPDVEPMWLQVPFRISNNARSGGKAYLECWAVGQQWMRPKEPGSIHENVYGTVRFYEMFNAVLAKTFQGQKACIVGGVRCEESPMRTVALTSAPTYKDITWGKIADKKAGQFIFYPLYDWSYADVWKAIHSNGWPYNRVYDWQYQRGIAAWDMRVSNLNHETALQNLFYLQEVEPETWAALTRRLPGINTVGILREGFFCPDELPAMFGGWKEYRDHLLKNLIATERQPGFRRYFDRMDERYASMRLKDRMYHVQIQTILANDNEMIKVKGWESTMDVVAFRQYQTGKRHPSQAKNKLLFG